MLELVDSEIHTRSKRIEPGAGRRNGRFWCSCKGEAMGVELK